MEPISLALSGGLGIANLFSDWMAKRRQADLQQAALNEARRGRQQSFSLATAPREDALGNRMTYSPGTGFKHNLTPTTEAILGSTQNEQLRNLREDAPAQRSAREAQFARSSKADEILRPFLDQLAAGDGGSKERSQADELYAAFADRNVAGGNDSVRTALRTGTTPTNTNIRDMPSHRRTILEAKKTGANDYLRESGAENQQLMQTIASLMSMANNTPSVPISGDNGARFDQQSGSALNDLLRVVSSGNSNVANSLSSMARSGGQGLNFNALQPFLAQLDGQMSNQKSGEELELERLQMERALGSNRLGIKQNEIAWEELLRGNQGAF